MNWIAVLALHHKAGTVWMNQTFRAICKALGTPFVSIDRTKDVGELRNVAAPAVLSDSHSKFKDCQWLLTDGGNRIFHLIRDPRDVIISSMHYHRKSDEKWLHVPEERYGGVSRQERLNSLADDEARYLFEIENSQGLARMGTWNYARPNTFECKYEDLIVDKEMNLFTRIASHLGFEENDLAACREVFWRNSLFGDKPVKKQQKHVRSGAPRQWPGVFNRRMGEAFVKTFGDILVQTGYEPDNSWVAALPDEPLRKTG
jgi:hypothetical protein